MTNMNFSELQQYISKVTDYPSFIRENRVMVNRYLNTVLWFCILTGPAIAVGIKLGIFEVASYTTCFAISILMSIVAFLHRKIIKRWPYSKHVGLLALLAMELLIVFMVYNHIHIHITWFFIPLLGILFCETKLFIIILISNYVAMLIATWLISPYNAGISTSYSNATDYFINTILGYTIETIVMLVGGLTITNILINYFTVLISRNKESIENAERLKEQMTILFSMAEVYDNVNLIDLKSMTEMSLSDQSYNTHELDFEKHAHTKMNHLIKRQVSPDHLDRFLEFTNLRTLENRLKGKRFIYGEFINVETGWFRAQYINVESYENGVPYLVVYTVQNINMDKRREEDLIRISLTDELTQLFNRRSLDNDLAIYKNSALEEDFIIASIDINRLKAANDTLGHAAGDELIRATANCLTSVIQDSGKVYRTGGDEFTAIIHSHNIKAIDKEIRKKAAAWKGNYCDSLAISIGYAAHKDYPDVSVEELRKIADNIMYDEKTKYYQETGYERRGRR
ncbi:sensor domain-containing diguanylate cyclase [Butyrivibrio sp. AE3004]|uniref:sensor domain-containing diguanylate cyclase n=1 Tax=Butyrivibrio sp. AE3004 TaxID=1506994 RepID=UPI000494B7A2|nr:GGDEF domain-containing protein [Butyrivibrio sp. AE3004]